MFVMLSVRTSSTVRERQTAAETVTKDINIAANLKNINCIKANINNKLTKTTNNNYNIAHNSNNNLNRNNSDCAIDKTIKKILPSISVDTTTILSPSALTTNQPAQNSNKFILSELNNYRKPPTVQVPVATILNDLSPVPAPAKDSKNKKISLMSPMTPAGIPSNSPDVKAMRYYRLWIYTCNAVLLMAVIVFCGVAGKVLLADYKRLLVNGLNLTQPSFIYAYIALLVQSGFLQLIGCLGALRLSEKLLNAYWLLLLVLLIGDAILGIFWMFKFDRIMHELQPMLRYRLAHEYGISSEITELWDRLQNEGRCCGVTGPQDFTSNSNRTYPTSCCTSEITDQISITRRPLASAVVFRTDDVIMREQQKNLTDITDYIHPWNHIKGGSSSSSGISGVGAIFNSESSKVIATCRAVYRQGCIDNLMIWLRHTADILFVLGYCVIAFLKLCFLGILRYEIKEMIQKIKLLQSEMAASILSAELGEQQLQQIQNTSINGGLHPEPKVGNRDRELTRIGSAESERETLLRHENTPKLLQHKQLYACVNEQSGVGGTCDSDTNSNCALIVDEATTSTSGTTKTINGNNNYELSEFDTKTSTYRLLNVPTVTKI